LVYNEDFPLRGYIKHDCGKTLTAAFAQGKKMKVGYYRCMHDNKNINADRMHEQMDNLLKELSLPQFYVEYLSLAVLKSLSDSFSSNKKSIEQKRKQLTQLDSKLDNIQEDRNNRVIDADSYKKWNMRYMTEKSVIEDEIETLSKPVGEVLKRYEQTLPLLTDMHYLYHKATTPQKHFILNRVFERSLTHDGLTFRTQSIMSVFRLKAAPLKEKGLLVIEQPIEKLEEISDCSPYEIRTRITTVKGWCPSP